MAPSSIMVASERYVVDEAGVSLQRANASETPGGWARETLSGAYPDGLQPEGNPCEYSTDVRRLDVNDLHRAPVHGEDASTDEGLERYPNAEGL